MLPVKLLSFLFHLQNTRQRESTNHPGTPVLSLLVYPQKHQKTTRSPRALEGDGAEKETFKFLIISPARILLPKEKSKELSLSFLFFLV